jgi:quercetin dioxygenase-like cupin family protein
MDLWFWKKLKKHSMNTAQEDNIQELIPTDYDIKTTLFHEYNKLMAQYDLMQLSEYKGTQDVQIENIPLDKTHFLKSSDEWQLLDLPENLHTTSCIYYGKKNNSFPVHKHENRDENLLVLQGGGVEYIMDNGDRGILLKGQSVVFPKGVGHYVKWLEDTVVLVFWSEKFKNED